MSSLSRKRVFLTGATGNMGWSGLQELLKRDDRFDVTILVRPSSKNRKKLKDYINLPNLEIVWGDLLCYDDVLSCVKGADYVLHLGGMVSPEADRYPEKTMSVNLTSAQNVVNAIKAQPNRDKIGAVYIGSVAQNGDHQIPNHWGRCGDPVKASKLDYYSLSKCLAELVFAESGLKKWVSIRQSGMLYPRLLTKANNPITFHVPFDGVLEWTTVEDSGRVLANVCEEWVPESFWRNFYNLSSGPQYRLTNYQFESLLLKTISCPPVERVFERNWFATRNFHGMWYLDADRLEEVLHFRENLDVESYFQRMKGAIPWYFSLAPIAPAFAIKAFMKYIASSDELGTLYWLKHDIKERVEAHFGSRQEWSKIGDWSDFETAPPSGEPIVLDHGYDEEKPLGQLDSADFQHAARFRGGECLSDDIARGAIFTPLRWRCACGNEFLMTPNAVLRGGHWCPECLKKMV